MKRILAILLLIGMCISTIVACSKKIEIESEVNLGEYVTLVIEEDEDDVVEYVVALDKSFPSGVISVLDYLNLEYNYRYGDFSRVGNLKSNRYGELVGVIVVYTNIDNVKETEYSKTIMYKGTMLKKTTISPTDIKIKNGLIIYFKLDKV